ncbi:MAG TPA: S-layer homology domain-containing protein [bacterium]|nr:S-layer homology domain-containing protein [bacterium]
MLRMFRPLANGFLLFLGLLSFAPAEASIPFTDVSTGDISYESIETLYEQGIIGDDGSHLFRPRELIARDDFTSIVMEVGCEECLRPDQNLILSYTSPVFPDVGFENENFYCIARAESLSVVRGYVLDDSGRTSCQDGTTYGSVPFCPMNNITRIEAAAVLLRHAGFWDEIRNANDYEHRYVLSDVSDYWYGYAMRAIDFELIAADDEGRVSPNEYINRAEFARMAAKILQSRLCEEGNVDSDDRFRTNRSNSEQDTEDAPGITGNNAG